MFSLLAISSQAHVFNKYVKHFTDLPPDDGTGYAIMFHSPGCKHCVSLAPTWNRTAELGLGLVQWGEMDCHENQTACLSLNIDSVPRIIHFQNSQATEYNGLHIAHLIIQWVSDFVNNSAKYVDASNVTEVVKDKAVLLLTAKPELPKGYAAIENYYNDSSVEFFYSNDKAVLEKIGQKDFPAVYAKNGQTFTKYNGKLNGLPAKEFLDEVFADKKDEL